MATRELPERDFEELRGYIHRLCGLYLKKEKRYLVLQRLEPLLEDMECETFRDFNRLLASSPSQDLHDRIIAAMTTNETSFFRDKHPFEAFSAEVLPALVQRLQRCRRENAEQRPLRFWSTAVSTGQEAYSLAMLVREFIDANPGMDLGLDDFHILATDISSRVLDRARTGVYNDVEIARGLSETRKERFFSRDGRKWIIADELRSMVDFQRINLTDPYGIYSEFDAILCRNVLIYFDDDTKRSIIDMLYRKLSDDGALLVGSAESLYNLTMKFHSQQVGETIVYRKNL